MRPEADKDADTAVHQWTTVNASGVDYLRLPLHTRWLTEADDLTLALKEHLRRRGAGDTHCDQREGRHLAGNRPDS